MQYLVETEIKGKSFRSTHRLLGKFILESSTDFEIEILTPTDPEQRGAQLSFRIIGVDAEKVFTELEKLGVCVSFRLHFPRLVHPLSSLARSSW